MSQSCYSAFQVLLKTLCLQEFPCGFGTWRNPKDKYAEGQYSVTTKDYGIHYEKMEVLQEFLNSGTWDVDTSWSPEASLLRSLAVAEPWKLTDVKGTQFIHHFFKKLRIIGKEVTDIDSNMLLLKNLQTLTLSSNLLEEVPSENLPRKLQVLELCTNLLSSVSSLCRSPPPLLHLGLSNNQLYNTDEYKYFTKDYWPNLMSLDLSYNNLTNLVSLVDKLSSLPRLKNLVLQGNPLSVIPGYRGYTIDTLRDLTIFDDGHISADEKHHFKGLGKKRELILNEAIFEIVFDKVSGIPMPDELKEGEDREEFPIVSTQYVVQYEMLEDTQSPSGASEPVTPAIAITDGGAQNTSRSKSQDNSLKVVEHESEVKGWEEDIKFNYRKTHKVENLVVFRDFLSNGMTLQILSKKTLTWPSCPSREGSEVGKKKSPRPGKESPAKKSKETKPKEKSAKGGKDKAKKKPLESDIETRSDPPVITLVGSYHLTLDQFLEGGRKIEESCHCGGGPILTQQEIDEILQQAQANQDAEPSTDAITPSRKSDKGRAGSGDKSKKSKPGSAGKKKDGKKSEMEEVPPEHHLPPKPITLNVTLNLQRWVTAMDSLK